MKVIFEHIINPVNCTLKSITRTSHELGFYVDNLHRYDIDGTLTFSEEDFYKFNDQLFTTSQPNRFALLSDIGELHFQECAAVSINRRSDHNVHTWEVDFVVLSIGNRSKPLRYVDQSINNSSYIIPDTDNAYSYFTVNQF